MHVDVTQLQRDSLTGLPNRALFDAQAQYVLDRTAQDSLETALIMLDLNRFKPINDTYGHLAGDYVLRAVAERLRDSVRDADFVARLGGDEFGLVLAPGTDFAGAHAIARRIGSQFDVPIEYDGRKIEVGASLGVALFPRDGTDVKGLLSIADARMYGMKGPEARRERGADQRTNAA
jgi:diguanylate cyclase (GGDEF)-like protein